MWVFNKNRLTRNIFFIQVFWALTDMEIQTQTTDHLKRFDFKLNSSV